jgi:hypothetical protein
MKMAKVGVLLDLEAAERKWKYGLNVFERYVEEILQHAGMPYESIPKLDGGRLSEFDILIVACSPENNAAASIIGSYAEQGGTVISYAGLNSLAARLGYITTEDIGRGYAELEPTCSGQPHSPFPHRRSSPADAPRRPSAGAGSTIVRYRPRDIASLGGEYTAYHRAHAARHRSCTGRRRAG